MDAERYAAWLIAKWLAWTWSSVSPHKAENEAPLGRNPLIRGLVRKSVGRGPAFGGRPSWKLAPRFGGFLQFAKAVLHLLLVLRLGQLALGDLQQLGNDRGLKEASDEVHKYSTSNIGDSAIEVTDHLQLGA
jgi:hypothetical protein